MSNQAVIPPLESPRTTGYRRDALFSDVFTSEWSLWDSLKENVRSVFKPEKLPPLKLTSRPVKVREIWGQTQRPKTAAVGSLIAHALFFGLIAFAIMRPVKQAPQEPPKQLTHLIAPPLSDYIPMQKDPGPSMAGGGGGGDHDIVQAPKGKLPKVAPEQFTPPVVITRNEAPKLPVEPTIVAPPKVNLPNTNMPTIGDPMAKLAGPPSNGVGSSAGIGSGAGGGIGSGAGAGLGPGSAGGGGGWAGSEPGRGGGSGGGVYRVGGGVSAPRLLVSPDPEYSEEARKAKYQGTVVVWLIVGPDGRPAKLKIQRALGMGLDEKALEAVKQWRFEPAKKDNQPVAVQLSVEVNFHLY